MSFSPKAASMGAANGPSPIRIAIVGGGLAGLAAAVALADSRLQRESNFGRLNIELFESRRMLGGRATSYRDPETGELIDNCQHVTLGCCTNFDDFCQRTSLERHFTRETTLHFLGPNQRNYTVRQSRWLPAPLHLAPSLLRLSYLTLQERCGIAKALRRLARCDAKCAATQITMGAWLRQQGQSERAIELFWSPVIVSALSEEIDRADYNVCRKVFVDGFLRHKSGYEMKTPNVALRTLYDDHLVRWLEQRRVQLRLGTEVRAIEANGDKAGGLLLPNGNRRRFDFVCIAAPWYRVCEMFESNLADRMPFLVALERFEAAPITSVHLWCQQKLQLPGKHAVLPGRFSQWIFDHSRRSACLYYQVVISASREAARMPNEKVIARVCQELEEITGDRVNEILVRSKVITEHRAVFSPTVGSEERRPSQATPIANLVLAGDWTATGWPATMEGAVRSGYLAAEALLEKIGARESILCADLPPARLSRWLLSIR